jgi:hypothetical protein
MFIPLAEEILKYNITVTGTLTQNKPEIPLPFLPSRNKEVGSSDFAFNHEKLLTSQSQVRKKT